MTAQEKIKEAHFFLRKLRENSDKIPDAYYYYSAFLSATLSILDHLMHDYAQKFNFTIPDDIRNLRKEFEKEAKNTNNHDALKFHEWWKSKKEYLTKKMNTERFFQKNDIIIFIEIHSNQISQWFYDKPPLKMKE